MKKKAFTLIELIAVLVILAILALIVTPLVMNIIRKAKDAANKRSVDAYGRSIELAIANYVLESGSFPSDLSNLAVEYSGNEVVCNVMNINDNGKAYLSECSVSGVSVLDNTDDGYYHYGKNMIYASDFLINKSNSESVTNYADGNGSEMYTFSHPSTEQTGSLTDYRYIGSTPNNYVRFNNELWRIIGVFNVDNGKGELKRRLKIVRDTSLADPMVYGDVNNWPLASLNQFLNNDYYNKILSSNKQMIADTKYYLGGRKREGDLNNYGTTEDMYSWERGSDVYQEISQKSLNWVGKIALMYPSDYGYTFSLGVDDICYNDPSECWQQSGANPASGWLYEDSLTIHKHLLSPNSQWEQAVFVIRTDGNIGSITGINERNIQPTLYLNEKVYINDGTGEKNNPYKLVMY